MKSVQHFTPSGSKNSADLSLTLDALADYLKGRVTHVAILSDDSDFAYLFLKIQAERLDDSDNKTPFLWLVTDRPDTRSATLSDFLPAEYLKVIVCAPVVQQKATVKASKSVKTLDSTTTEQIAQVILKEIPVGAFKSTDCQKIIIKHFPQNPLAKLSGANFGTQFTKTIWPLLKKHGVLEPNPNKRPRKYEMTKDTKGKL